MDDQPQRSPADDFQVERLEVLEPIRLQGVEVPKRCWVWDEWMPLHSTTAMYGDGGTGKTLLAQQFMTACATGTQFLGMPVMKCRVLGVFCEDDPEELHRRQAAINEALKLEFNDLDNMRWISRVGMDNLLCTFDPQGRSVPTPFFQQLAQEARDFGAQLVVIDTAADTFGGNENIRSHVRQFIAQLTRLSIKVDGAVLLLAHPSVAGRSSGQGDGGSTAWSNSVRSRWYVRRQTEGDDDDADPDVRVLSRMKANYARANADLTVRYQAGAFAMDAPPEGVSGAAGHKREQWAEEAFIAGLNELLAQNIRCNVHKGQANYAPRTLRQKTNVCKSFQERELAGAMDRLLRDKRITSVEEGPPSRRRSRLVVVEADLPGM